MGDVTLEKGREALVRRLTTYTGGQQAKSLRPGKTRSNPVTRCPGQADGAVRAGPLGEKVWPSRAVGEGPTRAGWALGWGHGPALPKGFSAERARHSHTVEDEAQEHEHVVALVVLHVANQALAQLAQVAGPREAPLVHEGAPGPDGRAAPLQPLTAGAGRDQFRQQGPGGEPRVSRRPGLSPDPPTPHPPSKKGAVRAGLWGPEGDGSEPPECRRSRGRPRLQCPRIGDQEPRLWCLRPGLPGLEGRGGGGSGLPGFGRGGGLEPACSRGAQPFRLGILLRVLLGRHVCVLRGKTATTSAAPGRPPRPRPSPAPPSGADVATPFRRRRGRWICRGALREL